MAITQLAATSAENGAYPMMNIQLAATIVAALAAAMSYFAVRALKQQTQASLVLGCLSAYIDIRRQRSAAVAAQSLAKCEDYYRELLDLHWSEYQLYSTGNLPKSVLKAWLDARRRNFKGDRLTTKDDSGTTRTITYAEIWQRLLDGGYFSSEDPFVRFMNLAHEGKIKEAFKCQR